MHGGNLKLIQRQMNLDARDLLDFSANINPLGIPDKLMALFSKELPQAIHYPDPDYHDLYHETAQYFSCNEKNLFLGNGAADVMYQWLKKLMPQKAVLTAPTFSEYENVLRRIKTDISYASLHHENQFDVTAQNLEPLLEKGTDLVVLCNPNNPTGRIIPSEEMDKILGLVHHYECQLVVDEAFIDFTEYKETQSLVPRIPVLPNVSVIRSFTKIFAIPGVRLGAVIAGNSSLVAQCKQEAVPWNINVMANVLHKYINTDDAEKYLVESRRQVALEREWLYDQLSALEPFSVVKSVANYLLVHWKDYDRTVTELRDRLLQSGIVIRDCRNFVGLDQHWFRVAVKKRAENEKLIKNITEAIQSSVSVVVQNKQN